MDGADPRVEAVGRYYEAIDAGAYDDLRGLLAPAFVHDRPDRTFEGRERFVAFMRDERPDPDTTHELTGIYVDATAVPGDESTGPDGFEEPDGLDGPTEPARSTEPADPGSTGDVLARGTLSRADGTAWFRFVDAFAFDGRAAGAASDTGGTSDSGGDAALAVRRITTFVRESVASG
jgi:hypothetical protein